MTTFLLFQPRPSPTGVQAMSAFLGIAAQACLSRRPLFRPPPSFSLELVATAEVVRFALVLSNQALARQLARELTVWHPGAAVQISEQEYLPRRSPCALAQLTLAQDQALPLGSPDSGGEPLASLISALHQLRGPEVALLQLVARPRPRAPLAALLPLTRQLERTGKSALLGKATQPGFAVALRLLTLAPTERAARGHLQALSAALAPLDGPWNRLRLTPPPLAPLLVRQQIYERRFGFGTPLVRLAAGELALLYHAPNLQPSACPKLLLQDAAPWLPPPARLPAEGILLGQTPAEPHQRLFLPHEARLRHLLLVGPTGAGKTHAMVGLLLQDIAAGRGGSLMTPSPDAIARILRRVPPEQLERIVLVRFNDPGWAFGLNPLAQPGVESWRISSELVAIWERLFPAFWGPLVSDMFKHGVMALTEQGPSSLLELVDLLEEPAARQRLLRAGQLRDPLIRRYWERFDDLTLGSQETRTRSSLNKIRSPLLIPWLRRTLGMPNSLSLRQAMDTQKVVLWDLSNLADEGKLLGALIASQYFQAGLNRADQPEEQRVPHYLYADEFHVWPTTAWSKGLDLLRQFRVGLVLCSQRLAQISDEVRQAALANVGSGLIWGLRSDADAVTMTKWLATPGLEAADLKRLGRYQTYARLLLDGAPSAALSLETLPLPPEVPDADDQERRILELSHQRYYRPADDVDRTLERRWHRGDDDPQSRPRRAATRAPADDL